jgi:hypothetical protein
MREELLLPLVSAVSFKAPGEEQFPGKRHFLECSLNIADADFSSKMEASGLLNALRSGKYESFACDIGPNCPMRREYSINGFPRAVAVGESIPDDVYLERATRNIHWLRGQFGGYVHAENLNYFPTGAYERVCEPEFVRRLIDATGIGLLLDVAHALISASNLGYADPMGYIRQLPLERVREIHASHAGELGGILEDLHEPPGNEEIRIAEEVVANGASGAYLTVEYYRDSGVLCQVYRWLADRLAAGAEGPPVEGECGRGARG